MSAPSLLGVADDEVIEQIIRRAASTGFDSWWGKVLASGQCARPIRLTRSTPAGSVAIFARCKDRRASVCPSCSALYAGDAWHLVHAGLAGGEGISESVARHPVVFATLTAPSFGAVHSRRTDKNRRAHRCHPNTERCAFGRSHVCLLVHNDGDEALGQPICPACYDYTGHALTTWFAPSLWHRFTIELRRLVRKGAGAGVRVSFLKTMEMQARAIPHYHAIIRLDAATPGPTPEPPKTHLTAGDLELLVPRAVARAHLTAWEPDGTARELGFGEQTDVQALTHVGDPEKAAVARHVAGYLAKYVTKSATDVGIAPHRIPASGIELLDVNEHVRALLRTFAALAELLPDEYGDMTRWLHTLGYRGHTSTKSRRYSTTMGALRDRRTQHQSGSDNAEGAATWEFGGIGHANAGERYLAVSGALKHHEELWAARQLGDTSSPLHTPRDPTLDGAR